ncbi:MAG: hypothetical protein P1U46_01865 [Patescibacteria group bacterium]|nr:hypothetical protein [Patescibacteria group bacterium]
MIDCSDPKLEIKIKVVEEILEKIEAKQDRIYVFNKEDALEK